MHEHQDGHETGEECFRWGAPALQWRGAARSFDGVRRTLLWTLICLMILQNRSKRIALAGTASRGGDSARPKISNGNVASRSTCSIPARMTAGGPWITMRAGEGELSRVKKRVWY